jgi:osmoprotectant transport system permease protein
VIRHPVLALLLLCALAAGAGLAFVSLAPNRLLSGQGVGLLEVLGGLPWPAQCLAAVPAAGLLAALWAPPQRWLWWAVLAFAASALLGLLVLAGHEAELRAAALPSLARVSLGGGFWVLTLLTGLMVADALQRLGLPSGGRWAFWAALGVLLVLLGTGGWDELSLLKEYDNRSDVFAAAAWRHLQIVAAALVPALLIGLPLGLAASARPVLATPLFALLNVIQTVPSLALFALLIAPLAALAAWLPGWGIQGIGLLPAALALTLYALLPIVHHTSAGLQQVPAAAVEAARGMGMTTRQVFWQVQLPLALPVWLAGLRVTTVQLIGLAVVAALIGAGGFGALVFQGLASSALDLVMLGVLPVVALALLADAALAALAEWAAAGRGAPA